MKRLLFSLAALAIAIGVVWLNGAKPEFKLARPLTSIGQATPVQVEVDCKSGVRQFRAWLEQGGQSFTMVQQNRITSRWKLRRPRQPEERFYFVAGTKGVPQLKDGPARLMMEAQADDFRGARRVFSLDVNIRTAPPLLTVEPGQHYINQGGSELVIFHVGPEVADSGVRVGGDQYRSWAVPGEPAGLRFAIFAYPYNLAANATPTVYAMDDAGNEATATFWFRVTPKKFRLRDIELTDDFMKKVENNIFPHAPTLTRSGDLLADFLKLNGELRLEDNRRLGDMAYATEERFLWREPFRQMANSQVEAQFADHRSYYYKGKKVDEQDHLGFDLATTANAAVVTANDGKVIFADFLGIYGNCIVIDHGYGLQSIYGHLASFAVKAGERVAQGQKIGVSDSTGLAGGDHLHFSMQVEGVTVNPAEWWDPHWIHDHVLSRFPGNKLPGG